MGYFNSLVRQVEGQYPNHFERVASRLREGHTALEVRNQLIEELDLSRLQAGKVVEDVEKAVRDWRIASGAGIGLALLAIGFFSPFSVFFWLCLFFGSAQAVAGTRGLQAYQFAEDPTNAS
jgi:hypothetical protein